MSGSFFEAYANTIKPFIVRRRPTAQERAGMLMLWAGLIVRHCKRRPVVARDPSRPHPATGGDGDMNEAFFSVPLLSSSDDACNEELAVFVDFLRFATLRKVIDDVIQAPHLVHGNGLSIVVRAVLHCAARVCAILPVEDQRLPSARRGFPWCQLDEDMESSDEDRDDGAPRPLDDVLHTAADLLVVHWSHIACPEVLATQHDIFILTEEVKRVLLRGASFGRWSRAGGALLAVALLTAKELCPQQNVLSGDDTPRAAHSRVALRLREPPLCEYYDGILEVQRAYTAKADAEFIRQWMAPAVYRCLSQSVHPALQRMIAQGQATTLPRHERHDAFERSKSASFAEALLEVVELHVTNGGPKCMATYMRRFPSRYGELSGHYVSTTEKRVINEARLWSHELQERAELATAEMYARRDLTIALFSSSATMMYPYKPASLPAGLQGRDVPYHARKKIASLLNSVCPDRYPVPDTLVAHSEFPDAAQCYRDAEGMAVPQALTLRVVREEVHFRLEWQRVEAYWRDRVAEWSVAAVRSLHARKRFELESVEEQARELMYVTSLEETRRLEIQVVEETCCWERIVESHQLRRRRLLVLERNRSDRAAAGACVLRAALAAKHQVYAAAQDEHRAAVIAMEADSRRILASLAENIVDGICWTMCDREGAARHVLHLQEEKERTSTMQLCLASAAIPRRRLLVRRLICADSAALFHRAGREAVARSSTAPTARALFETHLVWLEDLACVLETEEQERSRLLLDSAAAQRAMHDSRQRLVAAAEADYKTRVSRQLICQEEVLERIVVEEWHRREILEHAAAVSFQKLFLDCEAWDAVRMFESATAKVNECQRVETERRHRLRSLALSALDGILRELSVSVRNAKLKSMRGQVSASRYLTAATGFTQHAEMFIPARPTSAMWSDASAAGSPFLDPLCAVNMEAASLPQASWHNHNNSVCRSDGGWEISSSPGGVTRVVSAAASHASNSRPCSADLSSIAFVMELNDVLPVCFSSSRPLSDHQRRVLTPQPPQSPDVQQPNVRPPLHHHSRRPMSAVVRSEPRHATH